MSCTSTPVPENSNVGFLCKLVRSRGLGVMYLSTTRYPLPTIVPFFLLEARQKGTARGRGGESEWCGMWEWVKSARRILGLMYATLPGLGAASCVLRYAGLGSFPIRLEHTPPPLVPLLPSSPFTVSWYGVRGRVGLSVPVAGGWLGWVDGGRGCVCVCLGSEVCAGLGLGTEFAGA